MFLNNPTCSTTSNAYYRFDFSTSHAFCMDIEFTAEHLYINCSFLKLHVAIIFLFLPCRFTEEEARKPCSAFSGGWQMRIALARLLLSEPDLLLLDEPTNHLDKRARNWVANFIANYPKTAIVVRGMNSMFMEGILALCITAGFESLYVGKMRFACPIFFSIFPHCSVYLQRCTTSRAVSTCDLHAALVVPLLCVCFRLFISSPNVYYRCHMTKSFCGQRVRLLLKSAAGAWRPSKVRWYAEKRGRGA